MEPPTFFEAFVTLNLLAILAFSAIHSWLSHTQRNIIVGHLVDIRRELEYARMVQNSTYRNGADVYVEICQRPERSPLVEVETTPSRLELLREDGEPSQQ